MTTKEKELLYEWMRDVMHVLKQHVSVTPAVADAEHTLEAFRKETGIQLQPINHDED